MKEDGSEPTPQLVDLAAALGQGSKGEFVRCITCGGTATDLADRKACCTDGACGQCGFKRLWSNGVRKNLFTPAGKLRQGVDKVWGLRVYWSYYLKRPKLKTATPSADEDGDWEAKKKVCTETVVINTSGTLIEFLDALELVAVKHVYHRGILARQSRGALEYSRSSRPEALDLNIDYSENAAIEQARLLQQYRWTGKSCTLFICVASWLDKASWNSEDSELSVHDEVTVRGEKSGCKVALDSHWARVTALPGDGSDEYEVESSCGVKCRVPRRDLRHRSLTQQAHVGVTADPKHDSYSMRFFVGSNLKDHLDKQGVFKEQGFRVVAVHSDNASQVATSNHETLFFSAVPVFSLCLPHCLIPTLLSCPLSFIPSWTQHFKSSKTLKWFSELRRLHGQAGADESGLPKFDNAMYDFGAPGHGKG